MAAGCVVDFFQICYNPSCGLGGVADGVGPGGGGLGAVDEAGGGPVPAGGEAADGAAGEAAGAAGPADVAEPAVIGEPAGEPDSACSYR